MQSDTQAHFARGVEHVAGERYRQAITAFDKVLRLDPDDAYAYLGRGKSHLHLERHSEAKADFESAFRLLPEEAHPLVLLNIGFVQYQSGNIAEAIVTFDRIIDSSLEGTWNTYIYRGMAKHDLGQQRAAISDYDEYIRRHPNEGYPYFLRGFAKYELECLDAALVDFNQANRLLPQIHEIVTLREEVLFSLQFVDSSPSFCQDF